jgi:hypothetical protein
VTDWEAGSQEGVETSPIWVCSVARKKALSVMLS